jgi:hypothetical protein
MASQTRKCGLGRLRRPGLCGLLALTLLGAAGCTRTFFRNQADKEVQVTLTEKNTDPRWSIENWHVYPDPRARFADPTNPDHPPKPPDDPAAWDKSPHPQVPGKPGVAYFGGTGYLALLGQWNAENRAEVQARGQEGDEVAKTTTKAEDEAAAKTAATIAPGDVRGAKPLQPSPDFPQAFLIKLEQAVELGVFNSREFQDRREDLYLTALPVTLERFSFAAQFFAVEQAVRQVAGKGAEGTNGFPPGPTNDWTLNTTIGFAKLFSTGALMLFSIANQTVFEFANPPGKHTTSVSTMTLDLIQPLLRGAGRAVTLEPLTLAERDLLYEIRVFARFRKEFFVSIAGGGGGSISGGTFVPTGVISPTPFSTTFGLGGLGIIPGILPPTGGSTTTGLNQTPSSPGRLNLATAIPATPSGFLGTLLQYAQINIDQDNINHLELFLRLFEEMVTGGDISQLQVDLLKQQLYRGYFNLYSDQAQYYTAIDQFKLQLGLPTDLPLELDDTPLRPLIQQFRRFEQLFKDYEKVGKDAEALGKAGYVPRLREELRRLARTEAIVRGTRFLREFPRRWGEWERMTTAEVNRRRSQYLEERRRLMDERTNLQDPSRTLTDADRKRLTEIENRLRIVNYQIDMADFERSMREYEDLARARDRGEPRWRQRQAAVFRTLVNEFVLVLVEARNERLENIRKRWPDVPRVCVEGQDLLKVDMDTAQTIVDRTTLANRLDLMNVRAELNDAWRQIAVFANALMGTFNVEYRMTTNTPLLQAKPLDFGGNRTRHQLILNGELPLVRKLERNNYRAALIAFQRVRRALMEAEDLSMEAVRGEIRQLRELAEQYKLQAKVVELAYLTVENSLDVFNQPPQPGPPPVAGGAPAPAAAVDTATRAAALVNQLLQAQAALPIAQNAVLTAWVNYLNTRYQLYRDLELMQLDSRGVWIDDVADHCDGNAGCGQPADRTNASPAESAPAPEDRQQRLPEPRPVENSPGPELESPR